VKLKYDDFETDDVERIRLEKCLDSNDTKYRTNGEQSQWKPFGKVKARPMLLYVLQKFLHQNFGAPIILYFFGLAVSDVAQWYD